MIIVVGTMTSRLWYNALRQGCKFGPVLAGKFEEKRSTCNCYACDRLRGVLLLRADVAAPSPMSIFKAARSVSISNCLASSWRCRSATRSSTVGLL